MKLIVYKKKLLSKKVWWINFNKSEQFANIYSSVSALGNFLFLCDITKEKILSVYHVYADKES